MRGVPTVIVSVALLLGGCSSSEEASELDPDYLEGRWEQQASDCKTDMPAYVYTHSREVLIDGDAEAYSIDGNEVHYFNPISGSETYDKIVTLGPNEIKLSPQNGEWILLSRCPRPAEELEKAPSKSGKSGFTPIGDYAESVRSGERKTSVYNLYRVEIECQDIHGRRMPLTSCFGSANPPGRMGYVASSKERHFNDMELRTGSADLTGSFILPAPFTFYAQSYHTGPMQLKARLYEEGELGGENRLVEESVVRGHDTIAFHRKPVPPPSEMKDDLGDIMADDIERQVQEIERMAKEMN